MFVRQSAEGQALPTSPRVPPPASGPLPRAREAATAAAGAIPPLPAEVLAPPQTRRAPNTVVRGLVIFLKNLIKGNTLLLPARLLVCRVSGSCPRTTAAAPGSGTDRCSDPPPSKFSLTARCPAPPRRGRGLP